MTPVQFIFLCKILLAILDRMPGSIKQINNAGHLAGTLENYEQDTLEQRQR